ncbi:PINK1 [Lepeophtheirus salmonis]|uniref:non-specific serine/threonine protein kinase n=1 Tax=Lepeophtheirus salmonis TaxID=72036 RepID=A0A7R8CIX9_LEPSM|nr:PINK1 [Lepeophtheirus salmonis]CAF2805694.1 PINK1 [Lepeophtheirus salmonis]
MPIQSIVHDISYEVDSSFLLLLNSMITTAKGVASALTLQLQRSPNLYYRSFDRGRFLIKSNIFLNVANTLLKRFRITYLFSRTGDKIATTALKESSRVNVSLTSNWTSKFLSKFDATVHRRAIREIFGRGSPLLAFIGVSLASNSSSSVNGIVSKKDQIHSVVREIRQTVAKSMPSTLWKSQKEDVHGDFKEIKQVQDLDLGSPIAKGGVVMMFNYHAESNAFTIFKTMSNEILPAQIRNLDSNSDEVDYFMDYLHWRRESKIETTELPWHPNIVEMFTVFVDQIPKLPQSMSLYPDALPIRINPTGFGRNMSLFLLMKKYNISLNEFLSEQKATGIPMKTSLILLSQLLEGILHMVSNRVAHRDLKSDNILLEYSGSKDFPHLVITDFGCSIEIKEARPGTFVKLDYRKADLWAASNIAYEIFGSPNPAYQRNGVSQLPELVPNNIKELIKSIGKDDPNERISPLLAADICQLLLWAPPSWFDSYDDIKEDVVFTMAPYYHY